MTIGQKRRLFVLVPIRRTYDYADRSYFIFLRRYVKILRWLYISCFMKFNTANVLEILVPVLRQLYHRGTENVKPWCRFGNALHDDIIREIWRSNSQKVWRLKVTWPGKGTGFVICQLTSRISSILWKFWKYSIIQIRSVYTVTAPVPILVSFRARFTFIMNNEAKYFLFI